MEKEIVTLAISGVANALTSKDSNHILAVSDDIYDQTLEVRQSTLNTYLINRVDTIDEIITENEEVIANSITDINENLNTIDSSVKSHKNLIQEHTNTLNNLNATIDARITPKIAGIIANAPENYDTLLEIAHYIETDSTRAAQILINIETLSKQVIQDKGVITSYDDLVEAGHYSGSYDNEKFVMFVLVNNTEIAQIKLKYSNQQVFIEKRTKIDDIWSEWNDIQHNTINLTFTQEDTNYIAYYTGSSGSLVIELPSEGTVTISGEIGLNGYYELENGTLTGTSFTKFLDMTGITSVKIVSNVNPISAKIYT